MTTTAPEIINRRAASAAASTINEADRTVEVIWSTGAAVKRSSWEGEYIEELSMEPKAIRMDRFAAGMSLLDSHDNWSMAARLGTVVAGSVRVEAGKGYARVKFSNSAAAETIFRDLLDGHPIQISVGYKVHRYEKTEATGKSLPVLRAVDWEPMELSVVPIPADAGSHSRSIERTLEMTEQNDTQTRAERKRVADITALARSAKIDLGDEMVTKAIEDGQTVDAFRSAMLDHLISKEERAPTFPHSEMRGMGDSYQQQLDARQQALVARMTGKAPEGVARDFMGATLMDHARGLLEAQGVDTRGMSRETVLGYRGSRSFHTTSDFPLLLQGAGERVLMDAYALAASPLKSVLSRRSTATDFRAKSKLKVADAGLLERVSESGEITRTSRGEASESYRIESYARIFALSFAAITNDDLGAFADWSIQAGRMAALTENKVLLDLLLANGGAGPKMAETNQNLFHANHGNLAGSGTALDENNLAAAILAFRKQKAFAHTPGADGLRIAVAPKYLLVGPELEVPAQKLLASITPAKTADATPEVIQALVPVVEPNLDGKSWRLFADPAQQAVFEYSHLQGQEGVQVTSREGFDRLGTEFRAVLHYGAGAIDFRGAYMNPGV